MIKNKKDFRIIREIIENARIPLTELAKRTLLSREVVQYRLKNLEKNLIVGYQARANLNYFADSIYTIYLNIQKLERKAILAKLKSLPLVQWAGNTGGRYNVVITFSTDKENSLKGFIDKLFLEFKNNISHYSLTQHLLEYKDTFAPLFDKNENFISEKALKQKSKIDWMDKKIIAELTKNARASNLQIAEKLKTTRETIRQRIKNLEKKGVILNYRTLIKPSALGLENYILAIKCNNSGTEAIKPICEFLSNVNGCSYICMTAGEINILVTISVNKLEELDKISTTAQKEFSTIIREIEFLPLFEIGSQDYRI